MGFTVSTLDTNLNLQAFSVGNFKMSEGHSAEDVEKVIRIVINNRLSQIEPVYYVSDSANVNKSAV